MGTITVGERNKMLDAWAGRGAYSANTAVYVQLHTADPGGSGTTAIATNSTRKAVTFGTAATAGAISNTADIAWSSVPATETYTHISLWTASSGGTFIGSDDLNTSASVSAGATFGIQIGDLDIGIS